MLWAAGGDTDRDTGPTLPPCQVGHSRCHAIPACLKNHFYAVNAADDIVARARASSTGGASGADRAARRYTLPRARAGRGRGLAGSAARSTPRSTCRLAAARAAGGAPRGGSRRGSRLAALEVTLASAAAGLASRSSSRARSARRPRPRASACRRRSTCAPTRANVPAGWVVARCRPAALRKSRRAGRRAGARRRPRARPRRHARVDERDGALVLRRRRERRARRRRRRRRRAGGSDASRSDVAAREGAARRAPLAFVRVPRRGGRRARARHTADGAVYVGLERARPARLRTATAGARPETART